MSGGAVWQRCDRLLSPAVSDERRGSLLIIAAALLWSTGGLGIKWLPLPPLVVTFYRSAIAAVVLFLIFRPRIWRWSAPFLIAIISYAGCLTSFVIATKWTTAANAIFLQYSGAIWVLLLSPLVLKEPLRRIDVAVTIMALGGMALFFVDRFDTRGSAGNWVALLSSVFFATLVLSLRKERGGAAEAAVTYGNVLAALALLPLVGNKLRIDRLSLVVLLLLGIFQIAVAYAFFVRGLRYVSATQASLTGMVEPIANPLWVFLLLGEHPSPFAMAGGVVVLAAIGWRTAVTSPRSPLPPPPD
jgi:DME family drug/metabolite transporter